MIFPVRPYRFTDVMIKGHFKYFAHQHIFRDEAFSTLMVDVLTYRLPFGFLGALIDRWVIKKHLTRFLEVRNQAIKERAENDRKTSNRKVS